MVQEAYICIYIMINLIWNYVSTYCNIEQFSVCSYTNIYTILYSKPVREHETRVQKAVEVTKLAAIRSKMRADEVAAVIAETVALIMLHWQKTL